MLDDNSIPHNSRFKSFYNVVFIDEKWFYITKNINYYLLVGEDDGHKTCKNKNFVPKVMFLAAVTRPRLDNERNVSFSGKIGLYPFVYEQLANRSSVNRGAGTMEKKPIISLTREVNKMYLIDKVLPGIKNSWPIEDVGDTIFIQQDNARSHINQNDEDFRKATSEGEFDIQLICQPSNSLDLNILDLGFFNVIQTLQQKHVMKSIDDIISMVEKAFYEFSSIQSDKIFLTLQSCMIEIMKVKGSNKYKVPHMKKDSLSNQVGIQNQ
ncbi:uncharacterized protein LOC130712930 [Lotus japonicus]|uniref:uncharacterized protein LOC130712930 n=1 Tax=Lotus japonicus TaxID=34305 RepID=UPI00258CC946|nr:uncharacterized protein LOC130712930 [Lotus japonicus]